MMEEVESCGKLGEKRSETRKTQRRQQVNKKITIKNKKISARSEVPEVESLL